MPLERTLSSSRLPLVARPPAVRRRPAPTPSSPTSTCQRALLEVNEGARPRPGCRGARGQAEGPRHGAGGAAQGEGGPRQAGQRDERGDPHPEADRAAEEALRRSPRSGRRASREMANKERTGAAGHLREDRPDHRAASPSARASPWCSRRPTRAWSTPSPQLDLTNELVRIYNAEPGARRPAATQAAAPAKDAPARSRRRGARVTAEKPTRRLAELAAHVGGELLGDARHSPSAGVNGLAEAGPGELSFYGNPRYRRQLEATRASAVLVGAGRGAAAPGGQPGAGGQPAPRLRAHAPTLFHPPAAPTRPACSPGAIVHPERQVVHLGHGDGRRHRGARAPRVGARSVLFPGVYLGEDASVGADCLLYPNVTVREGCVAGRRGSSSTPPAWWAPTASASPSTGRPRGPSTSRSPRPASCASRTTSRSAPALHRPRDPRRDGDRPGHQDRQPGADRPQREGGPALPSSARRPGCRAPPSSGTGVVLAGQVGVVGHIRWATWRRWARSPASPTTWPTARWSPAAPAMPHRSGSRTWPPPSGCPS